MGTWGISAFENDNALDWLGDFCDDPSEEVLTDAFTFVNEIGEEYLEAPESENALIAAEVVSSLINSPSSDLLEHSKECIDSQQIKPDAEMISSAIKAVERVKADSELKELWEETDDFQEWNKIVDDLIVRLKIKFKFIVLKCQNLSKLRLTDRNSRRKKGRV